LQKACRNLTIRAEADPAFSVTERFSNKGHGGVSSNFEAMKTHPAQPKYIKMIVS